VSGGAVEIVVALLAVFAVVALIAGEAEEALLEDGIAAVPESDGEADLLAPVADASQAVLIPAVRLRAGLIVRKIFPGGPAVACSLRARCPRRAR
jgi:hypothetical protein